MKYLRRAEGVIRMDKIRNVHTREELKVEYMEEFIEKK